MIFHLILKKKSVNCRKKYIIKTQIHKGAITHSESANTDLVRQAKVQSYPWNKQSHSERLLPQCTVLPKAALLPAIFFLALVPSLRKSRLISTYDLAINNCHPSKIHLHSPKLKEWIRNYFMANRAKHFIKLHLCFITRHEMKCKLIKTFAPLCMTWVKTFSIIIKLKWNIIKVVLQRKPETPKTRNSQIH